MIEDEVAWMESEGLRVTIRTLADRTGWTRSTCSVALRMIGKSNRRGRPTADFEAIKVQVGKAVADRIAEGETFQEDHLVAATGLSRHAVRKGLSMLGIRLVRKMS